MILCCSAWLSIGYATCYVMSSASQCPSPMQPIALETFEAGGEEDASIACDTPAVSCAATELPSCCLQDCMGDVQSCGTALSPGPHPSCCGGYCGETPIGPDMPATVTAKCGAGPTMVEGCCDATSMTLPPGFANTSSEWTLGFGEPALPDASDDAVDEPLPAAPMPEVVEPAPGPPNPGDKLGGCSVSGPARDSLSWLLVFGVWAVVRLRRR